MGHPENSTPSQLIVISAPSGTGKTTLCQKLLEDFPSLVLSISSTTRLPRGTEKEGIAYFFLSSEEFQARIAKHLFAEWAQVHGNYYGTSVEFIERIFKSKRSVLLDIDVQGAAQLKKSFPQNCRRIFIAPPDLQELEKRLRARKTDSDTSIKKRLENANQEMQAAKNFDHIVVNDDLNRAYAELKNIMIFQYGFIARKE